MSPTLSTQSFLPVFSFGGLTVVAIGPLTTARLLTRNRDLTEQAVGVLHAKKVHGD